MLWSLKKLTDPQYTCASHTDQSAIAALTVGVPGAHVRVNLCWECVVDLYDSTRAIIFRGKVE